MADTKQVIQWMHESISADAKFFTLPPSLDDKADAEIIAFVERVVAKACAIDDETRESLILLKQFLLHGGELTTAGAERLLAMTERFLGQQ